MSVQKKFFSISNNTVPKSMIKNEASRIAIPLNVIEKLPELKENPFRTRICQVFSKDGSGDQTFEDFLDMLSIFSEQATRDMKVFYAFKIYDFDNDNHIGCEDICTALRLLTHNELSVEEMVQVYEKAMEEGDVDGDGKLSFIEFHHVILRSPEFFSTFHIRI
ncbi:calcium and integrin-binding family member 3 isoform X2 [Cimex lectularius]|uniref:EF-hand domain-containing protein n=1 Tax=Cimex lectularius TaxID=79782 RepID=A0A8I6S549_CIMLE|nr:calcium and integrin-binding family member 3 isoform X2 [Cimex lectularius]